MKTALFILLILWGLPSTFFRSKFRKIVYQTDDWKINIKPIFIKEIKGLLFNLYPENEDYLKTRNSYRIYLLIYLFIFYSLLFLQLNFSSALLSKINFLHSIFSSIIVSTVFLFYYSSTVYNLFVEEDGIIEYSTAIFLLSVSIYLINKLLKTVKVISSKNIGIILFSIIFFLDLGRKFRGDKEFSILKRQISLLKTTCNRRPIFTT